MIVAMISIRVRSQAVQWLKAAATWTVIDAGPNWIFRMIW